MLTSLVGKQAKSTGAFQRSNFQQEKPEERARRNRGCCSRRRDGQQHTRTFRWRTRFEGKDSRGRPCHPRSKGPPLCCWYCNTSFLVCSWLLAQHLSVTISASANSGKHFSPILLVVPCLEDQYQLQRCSCARACCAGLKPGSFDIAISHLRSASSLLPRR